MDTDEIAGRRTAAVAHAAAALDRVCPGWAARIDVGVLDLPCPKRCILGQLYRPANLWWHPWTWGRAEDGYRRGVQTLIAARVLFTIDFHVFAAPVFQDAWIAAIADRLHPIVEPSESPRLDPAVSETLVRS